MFYIGIDIAKRSHVATILDSKGERVGKHFSFLNSQDGFDKLKSKLTKLSSDTSKFVCGMEATSSFVPQENIKELRELVKLRAHLIKNRNSYKRKMMSLMQVLFPEYPDIVSTHFGKVSLSLLM